MFPFLKQLDLIWVQPQNCFLKKRFFLRIFSWWAGFVPAPTSAWGEGVPFFLSSPVWWTWRCGETLHAPPASPGPSGRSGFRLWRTPAPGSTGQTWEGSTESSLDFFWKTLAVMLRSSCTRNSEIPTSVLEVSVGMPPQSQNSDSESWRLSSQPQSWHLKMAALTVNGKKAPLNYPFISFLPINQPYT